MRKLIFACVSVFLGSVSLFAADLVLGAKDVRITYESGTDFSNATGYHLFIRKKPDIASVLLTETTKDPSGASDSYAYRASSYNTVNGDEIRYLNGKPLTSESAKYSLIDSTPEPDDVFGEAFHIYIPAEIQYGYPWTRNGSIRIDRGTFINIRAFTKKYADYSGADYYDNPFMFDVGSAPAKGETPVLNDDYNPAAVVSFADIARLTGGQMVYSKGPETLVDDVMASLARIDPKTNVDVVFAIDATGSMKDDIQKLRDEWIPQLTATLGDYGDLRLGLLLYRDYGDNFLYQELPVKFFDFSTDMTQFMQNLNDFTIRGTEGGDIPEAVYEALSASIEFYGWRPEATKKIVLIGDAEPHPKPRGTGKYTKERVLNGAQSNGIVIDTIIVPDDKPKKNAAKTIDAK